MKIKFKKYLSVFIILIPTALFAYKKPDLELCRNISFTNKLTYKEPKSGEVIAKRLNKRFNNLVNECKTQSNHSSPAYECSGILLQAVVLDQPEFWKGNEEAFSYFRADLNTYKFFHDRFISYAINGRVTSRNPYGKQAYAKCAYPLDGVSRERPSKYEYEKGCTRSKLFPNIPGRCSARGITTLEEWKKDFNKIPTGDHPRRYAHQCSFDSDRMTGAKDFALNLEARRSINLSHEERAYIQNEVVIRSWKSLNYKPQDIPIEAIIYTDYYKDTTLPGTPLNYAQAMQCAYTRAIINNASPGKRIKYPIPIIFLDLHQLVIGGRNNLFQYKERDQRVRVPLRGKIVTTLYFMKMF
ncbi:hypothetical protein FE392_11715 [Xenorhabdus sp. 12]|uniref:Uncharacterized protein n=1 Tax=Xenorhabdus santafensis TaxID=2582833 RepID=A0ABU4SB14_9GAMM|nr:hypothetical protein [Xenorhabdus sp. 12]MDX7987992.1 hypothetical protein [Xenorhabdus sp. 12]